MYNEAITDVFEELHELAMWEGCETGDLCHALMDLYEGCASYASNAFQCALEKEILENYECLKEQKAEEDSELNESQSLDTCCVIVVNGMTTSYMTATEAKIPEDIPAIVKEYLTSLE